MDDLDRFFVKEVSEVICANHPTVAIGIYKAGVNCGETATKLLTSINVHMPYSEASELVQKNNIGARVQGIVIARLLSEHAAAMEDFSAFCYAVKNRHGGIMKQYYKDVGNKLYEFLDQILVPENKNWDLYNILGLPSLGDLENRLEPDLFRRITLEYHRLSEFIRLIAKQIRRMESDETTVTEIDHKESIQIIYSMIHKDEVASNPPVSGLLVRIYNKIKHRFMYIESIDEFKKLETEYNIKFGFYSRKPQDVKVLFDTIKTIGHNTNILAQLILRLDREGIEI